MNNDSLTTEKQPPDLEQLRTLLQEQFQLVKKGDYRGVDRLLEQTASVIQKLSVNPPSSDPKDKDTISSILELFQTMELMIEAEKELANKQLQKVASGKKTIRAYQH